MKSHRKYKKKLSAVQELKEPMADYGKWKIKIFHSFEEENEHTAKLRAELSYDERLIEMEMLRRAVYHQYLTKEGDRLPIVKTFRIMPPYTNEVI